MVEILILVRFVSIRDVDMQLPGMPSYCCRSSGDLGCITPNLVRVPDVPYLSQGPRTTPHKRSNLVGNRRVIGRDRLRGTYNILLNWNWNVIEQDSIDEKQEIKMYKYLLTPKVTHI